MGDQQDTTGLVEASVRADIAAMGQLTSGVRATMATMSYGLARALDRAHIDPETKPAMIAAINKELRATLAELTRTQSDTTRRDKLSDILSSPDYETPEMSTDLGNAEEL